MKARNSMESFYFCRRCKNRYDTAVPLTVHTFITKTSKYEHRIITIIFYAMY
ncbi:hypothetical protein CLOSTHATH_00095 [Hungatella hathewayi DSM 13479]|uniref:Uncharacterized protein n=1 Tax=Hungatella hathewayi DSM 13479 TaxID=566550 RepID=D3A925_9FIRM|nr:hypothetical protein CLOSTHATH_00095 [Hungatella hathewayi DSM 13479]